MQAKLQHATPKQEAEWRKKITAQNQRLLWYLFGLLMLIPIWTFYTSTQRDNLLAAVVRDALAERNDTTIFLKINGADPSDAFLKRFDDEPFVMRKASQATDRTPPEFQGGFPLGRFLFDSVTGKQGGTLDIRMYGIILYGPLHGTAQVDFPGSGSFCKFVRTWRGWVIVSRQGTWIT